MVDKAKIYTDKDVPEEIKSKFNIPHGQIQQAYTNPLTYSTQLPVYVPQQVILPISPNKQVRPPVTEGQKEEPKETPKKYTQDDVPEEIKSKFPHLQSRVSPQKPVEQQQKEPSPQKQTESPKKSDPENPPKIYTQDDVPEEIKNKFPTLNRPSGPNYVSAYNPTQANQQSPNKNQQSQQPENSQNDEQTSNDQEEGQQSQQEQKTKPNANKKTSPKKVEEPQQTE